MNIGEKIEQIRLANKLSQEEMGNILNVSQQVYSNLANGVTKNIKPEIVEKIKEHFKINILQDKIVNENAPVLIENADGKLLEMMVQAISTLRVHSLYIAEIYAKSSGSLSTAVLKEMERLSNTEVGKIVDELKLKSYS
ncbi:MAG: helix-turn-helix transcriptional regulator [Chitinophagaceae bacterium]|nr:helix-turn-helix transcriptional regulator [Chitinophagaceae bacterium]